MELSQPPSGWFRRRNPTTRLEDTNLARAAKNALRQVIIGIGNRGLKDDRKSNGSFVLFTGPGRAKEVAAEATASALNSSLFSVDLSVVTQKYIGDTEKHLAQLFGDAEQARAILFFDEADALFETHNAVKDAQDDYPDIVGRYIIERLKNYNGLVIFSVNTAKNVGMLALDRECFVVEV